MDRHHGLTEIRLLETLQALDRKVDHLCSRDPAPETVSDDGVKPWLMPLFVVATAFFGMTLAFDRADKAEAEAEYHQARAELLAKELRDARASKELATEVAMFWQAECLDAEQQDP